MDEDLTTTETKDGHEDKSNVIVIPWKAATIAKYAAKERCRPIAYKEGSNQHLAAYRQAREDEEISQQYDDGRASG